eukprot:103952-Pleurochrysis_carterae.AAC.1
MNICALAELYQKCSYVHYYCGTLWAVIICTCRLQNIACRRPCTAAHPNALWTLARKARDGQSAMFLQRDKTGQPREVLAFCISDETPALLFSAHMHTQPLALVEVSEMPVSGIPSSCFVAAVRTINDDRQLPAPCPPPNSKHLYRTLSCEGAPPPRLAA